MVGHAALSVFGISNASTNNSLCAGIIRNGLQVIPSSRCETVADASTSIPGSTWRTCAVSSSGIEPAARGQLPADFERVALQIGPIGGEHHTWVVLGVEEVSLAQV